jgi:predicted RNase H-like HicB family nuclease/DNA-binding XRE family transcriptional regulator
MKVTYPVRILKEEDYYSVQGLEPLTGVITDGDTLGEALKNAREALTGVLGAMLDHGMEIPDPLRPEEAQEGIYWVEPDLHVSCPILIRKARIGAGMTQADLARRVGVTFQQVQKWERSGTNPTVVSLEKIFKALGRTLDLSVA